MTMAGMINLDEQRKARRSARSKRMGKMFAVGIAASLIGGGVAIIQNAPGAQAGSQSAINAYIKSEGGIPPCTHEDGSGQKGACVWLAHKQGNGKGYSYLAVDRKGKDDALIYITGPQAVRR